MGLDMKNRHRIISDDLAEIELTQGYWTLVDIRNLALLGRYRWCASRVRHKIYAVTRLPGQGGKCIQMHVLLMGTGPGVVDHFNDDGLDNRYSNLRRITNAQNTIAGDRRGTGVSYNRGRNKWDAYVGSRANRELKQFNTEAEALAWRDAKLLERYGNIIPPKEEQH